MLSEITYEQTPHFGVVFSEYANLFPMIDGKVRDELKADIAAHGVRTPVVFLGEQILDGRNRYTIARELGINYPRQEYLGDDPLTFVLSANMHRRHLTDSQRAMVAAKLAKIFSAEKDKGIRSAAAKVRWDLEREYDELTKHSASYDAKQAVRYAIEMKFNGTTHAMYRDANRSVAVYSEGGELYIRATSVPDHFLKLLEEDRPFVRLVGVGAGSFSEMTDCADALSITPSQWTKSNHSDVHILNVLMQNCQSANLHTSSVSLASSAMNVSEKAIHKARVIDRSGVDELKASVESGDISLDAAAAVATLPAEQQAEIIRSADPKVFAKVAKEVRAVKQAEKKAKRAEREVALAVKQKALPDARFGVIYADPAWRYETFSAETGMDRSADNHYPTASIDEIRALPVSGIAADDCALFLWATAPMLPEALSVMAAWGFEYKSQYIWNKDVAGTGYWNRNKHEILLVGTRGKVPAPAMGTQYPSVIDAPVGRHSAKPEIFAEMIEAYFPNLPKIELNRRGPSRDGWLAWGNEAEETA